jgi:hypothetical protein
MLCSRYFNHFDQFNFQFTRDLKYFVENLWGWVQDSEQALSALVVQLLKKMEVACPPVLNVAREVEEGDPLNLKVILGNLVAHQKYKNQNIGSNNMMMNN